MYEGVAKSRTRRCSRPATREAVLRGMKSRPREPAAELGRSAAQKRRCDGSTSHGALSRVSRLLSWGRSAQVLRVVVPLPHGASRNAGRCTERAGALLWIVSGAGAPSTATDRRGALSRLCFAVTPSPPGTAQRYPDQRRHHHCSQPCLCSKRSGDIAVVALYAQYTREAQTNRRRRMAAVLLGR
jgi:hypothetical protein